MSRVAQALRTLLVAAALALGLGPAAAQLLPAGFFDQQPASGGQAQVEADMLSYNAATGQISAEGGVILRYEGYELRAERVSFNQKTEELFASGNVRIRDPLGNEFVGERVEVTDRLKKAFVESLTITTSDGSLIKATDVNYASELETILTDADYSPCGLCIDEKGRKIGWKVNASKIVYDRDRALVFLEGAGLELLGIPVAWVPWFVLPDPSQPRAQGFRLPSVTYADKTGLRVDLPYFVPVAEEIDLILTPSVMTRQGLLMQAEWTHRLPMGYYDVKASGLYQLNPGAFTFPDAQRQWRGAFQTTGKFKPAEDWTTGWSYTAFTDAAYLIDYSLQSSKNVINEVYATYLTKDLFFDVRARQFNLLGDVMPITQQQHARAIPSIEAASYHDLGEFGRIDLSAEVLGVQRGADHTGTFNGVPYVFAYEEQKLHATLEAAWQNQYILPMGLVATPYLGLRVDAANFTRTNPALPAPYPTPAANASLLEATPIAAIDVRWPLVAVNGYDSQIFEPIAQLVYRGSTTTLTGIVNDNSQSFVFDDTQLFSYDRFSGPDRQETGLRANIGARYLANFEDGSWLQLLGGQSFHLMGTNGLGVVDHSQTGNSTGLGSAASYVVLGAQGSPGGGLNLGAKAQLDPAGFRLVRFATAGSLAWEKYTFGAGYTYIPANPAVGTIADQHEMSASVSGPIPGIDYWYADLYGSWDFAQNSWLEAGGGLTYDDGYLVLGAFGQINGPTHVSPNATTFGFRFKLRGPAGEWGL